MGKFSFPLILLILLIWSAGCAGRRIIILEDPLTPEEHLQLGLAYEKKGEADLALREYQLAAKKQPLAHYFLGNLYFEMKDYSRAEKEYRQAIKKSPDDPRAYNNLAWLYYTQDRKLDQAEDLARRAVDLAGPSENGPYRDTLDRIIQVRSERPRSP